MAGPKGAKPTKKAKVPPAKKPDSDEEEVKSSGSEEVPQPKKSAAKAQPKAKAKAGKKKGRKESSEEGSDEDYEEKPKKGKKRGREEDD